MHFRAPHRNLAITLLLTGAAGCNDEQPDTTSDTDATAGTAAAGTATAGGQGSQDAEADETDGLPNDAGDR